MMSYTDSHLDWAGLRALAARVARETKVARRSRTETKQVTRTREVRGGFLRLAARTEQYTVPVTETVADDYWILEERYWKLHEQGSGSMADETTYEWTYYCLGVDGSLFVRHEHWEEVWPKGMPYFENREAPKFTPMTPDDIALLDFAPESHHTTGRRSVETNRDPDKRKPRGTTKGAGLRQKLEGLLPSLQLPRT